MPPFPIPIIDVSSIQRLYPFYPKKSRNLPFPPSSQRRRSSMEEISKKKFPQQIQPRIKSKSIILLFEQDVHHPRPKHAPLKNRHYIIRELSNWDRLIEENSSGERRRARREQLSVRFCCAVWLCVRDPCQ